MKITKLKATKKGDRVNVYLDGKFAFSIARKFVSDFVLFRGKELDEDKIEEIKGKDLQDRYFQNIVAEFDEPPEKIMADNIIKEIEGRYWDDAKKFK